MLCARENFKNMTKILKIVKCEILQKFEKEFILWNIF